MTGVKATRGSAQTIYLLGYLTSPGEMLFLATLRGMPKYVRNYGAALNLGRFDAKFKVKELF